MSCILCGFDGGRVCDRCRRRVDASLAALMSAYTALRLVEQPGGRRAERVSGSKSPGPPGRLDVLSLRGPGGLSTWATDWAAHWRAARGFSLPEPSAALERALRSAVGFLRVNLPWICEHGDEPDVLLFADQAADTLALCRSLTGTSPGGDRRRIGTCPNPVGNGQCGATLYASPWLDHVTCGRCGADWPRERWLLLAGVLRGQ